MDSQNLNKSLLNNAAIYGVYLGVYFLLKYVLYIYMIPNFALSIPYYLLTAIVPVIVYFMVKDFKKRNYDMNISFGSLWRYGVLLYVFASIISMFGHYYYFKFKYIDSMYAVKDLLEQYSTTLATSPKIIDLFDESIMKAIETPAYQLVLNDFGSNIIGGAIVSLFVALILRKK